MSNKPVFTERQACEQVAEQLRHSDDHSRTTIRCALNDAIEFATRDGMQIEEDFDQKYAVDCVLQMIGTLKYPV